MIVMDVVARPDRLGRMVVDLREVADANGWAWQYEQSYAAEKPEWRNEEAPWLVEIPCERGKIYPYGRDLLTAWTDTKGCLKRLLAVDPQVRRGQVGDDESTVVFPAHLLQKIAAVMDPVRHVPAPTWEQRAKDCLERWPKKRRARKAA